MGRMAPVLGLFFLAPLVGEFLLGNLPITLLPALILLGPLYGGGALLIRETARRWDLAWPGMLILCFAFGIFEEVFVTQSLFNPNYLGLRLLDAGYIPFLGLGAWWTVFVLSLHSIWSTAVPIALIEALASTRRRLPWLGRPGLIVTAVVFVLGSAVLLSMELKKGFVASPAQFAISALVVVGVIGLAFVIGQRWQRADRPDSKRRAPSAFVVAGFTFVCGGAFFAAVHAQSRLAVGWSITGMLLVLFIAGAEILAWSRRTDWTERHRLAAAGGFLLTYAWYGFVQRPSAGGASPAMDLAGNVIFATGAIALLATAAIRVRREEAPSSQGSEYKTAGALE